MALNCLPLLELTYVFGSAGGAAAADPMSLELTPEEKRVQAELEAEAAAQGAASAARSAAARATAAKQACIMAFNCLPLLEVTYVLWTKQAEAQAMTNAVAAATAAAAESEPTFNDNGRRKRKNSGKVIMAFNCLPLLELTNVFGADIAI